VLAYIHHDLVLEFRQVRAFCLRDAGIGVDDRNSTLLFVSESLVNAAFELAATKGMADVTVNKVSELPSISPTAPPSWKAQQIRRAAPRSSLRTER
jgi:hypothetical protein